MFTGWGGDVRRGIVLKPPQTVDSGQHREELNDWTNRPRFNHSSSDT